jgi:hypothetical protein
VALTCAACGTQNPEGAAFCSMCRAIFARRASPSAAPELELAIEPSRPSAPVPARRERVLVDSRTIAIGHGLVAVVRAEGSALRVEMHGATVSGVMRSVALGALGVLFVYAAHAQVAPTMTLALRLLAACTIVIALWTLGFTLTHRFEERSRAVERTRTWLGLPMGRWSGTVDHDARIEVVIGIAPRRNVPPVHTLVLHTATGDTTIARGTDLTNLQILGRDIARFCGLPTPRNV